MVCFKKIIGNSCGSPNIKSFHHMKYAFQSAHTSPSPQILKWLRHHSCVVHPPSAPWPWLWLLYRWKLKESCSQSTLGDSRPKCYMLDTFMSRVVCVSLQHGHLDRFGHLRANGWLGECGDGAENGALRMATICSGACGATSLGLRRGDVSQWELEHQRRHRRCCVWLERQCLEARDTTLAITWD